MQSIYDLNGLSQMLKISIRTLREYIKDGKLKAKKIGRTYSVFQNNVPIVVVF